MNQKANSNHAKLVALNMLVTDMSMSLSLMGRDDGIDSNNRLDHVVNAMMANDTCDDKVVDDDNEDDNTNEYIDESGDDYESSTSKGLDAYVAIEFTP